MKALSCEPRTFVSFIALQHGHIRKVGEAQQVPDRNPHQELFFPEACVGFVFYDRDVVTIERAAEDGEGPTKAMSEPYRFSGIHYRIGRELKRDAESPQDRMIHAMIEMTLDSMGVSGAKLAQINDPDNDGVAYVGPLRKDDVIVREPPPPSERESRCDGCSAHSFCSSLEMDLGSLSDLFRSMRGGRSRRERPAPDSEGDSKQDPAAAPAE
ncbi:MAG: hypothetical protein PHX87_01970 [Candidatus Peribacteraceae bacterium]|nr:hypothetical protein [Candidatus Peribacteraceae bacterium]MDD5742174.1 hypothetical protein [Candidatus Peribacteraceae bacterium]